MKYYIQKMDEDFKIMHSPISKCAFCGKVIKQGEEFVAWTQYHNITHRVSHIVHTKHIKESELEDLYAEYVAVNI